MYELPPPPKPLALPSAQEMANYLHFKSYLTGMCTDGGGLLDPRSVFPPEWLAKVGLPAFWAAVEAELAGTPWKLEPSGLRDGGASRRLLPR